MPCSCKKLDEPRTHENYTERAAILKALAHPTRLFIVDVLNEGEKCVCELTELIGADVSTVSKHLAVLRNSGLVVDEKRGLNVYYRIKMPCVMNFLGCVEDVIKTRAEFIKKIAE